MSQSTRVEVALGHLSLTYHEYAGMSAEQLRRHWRAKIKTAHPDLPQNRANPVDPAAINAAYDTLRNNLADRARLREQDPARYDRATIAPPWQPDKMAQNNRIHVESYRDQNFIKKRIWELSAQSDEVYTIDAFGRTSFEGRTQVYGSKAVFDEMARAMLIWNANGSDVRLTRAILVSSPKQEKSAYLIYADGKSLANDPIPLEYKAGAPHEDKTFQARLPAILDHLRDMLVGRAPLAA